MKSITRQTERQLRFNIEDAEAAISARPSGPKVRQYLQEVEDCRAELQRREAIRCRRDMAKRGPTDVLARPAVLHRYSGRKLEDCARTRHATPLWRVQDSRDAIYALAFLTHCHGR